jgi:hypothetical protein
MNGMGRPQLGFPRLRFTAGRAGGIAIGPDHTPPGVTRRQNPGPGGAWEELGDGGARFMLLDGTWRYVTAEEIRDSIEAREHIEYRRKCQWMNGDDLDAWAERTQPLA